LNIVVVGTQWGDEGKGRVIDFLSQEVDAIVRFQEMPQNNLVLRRA